MPVEKYRRIEDVAPPRPAASPAANLRAACELVATCRRLHPWQPHRGVQRRTATDAARAGAPAPPARDDRAAPPSQAPG